MAQSDTATNAFPSGSQDHIDATNYKRVCLYLTSCANYVPEPEDAQILRIVCDIFKAMDQLPDAVRIALRLGDQVCAETTA